MTVVLSESEPDASLDTVFAAQLDAPQRSGKCTFHLAEAVVGLFKPVQTHAYVIITDLSNLPDIVPIDQRTVAGKANIKTHVLGTSGYLKDILAHQRFTAGKNQHRHPKLFQIVHDGEGFGRGEFARKIDIGGYGIAVVAGERAAADQVPADNRAWRFARRTHRYGIEQGLHVLGDSKHGYSLALRRKPVFFRMRVENRTSWARQCSPSSSLMAAMCD